MYDRLVRADLLESDRFIDLPTDTHRILFVGLLFQADDFGNLDGNPRRLYRWAASFSQIKAEADLAAVMDALVGADLARYYAHEGKAYYHLPRFKSHRRYTTRKHPRSPWCDADALTSVQRMNLRRPTADLPQEPAADLPQIEQSQHNQRSEDPTCCSPDADMPQTSGNSAAMLLRGVGVGVGVGEELKTVPPLQPDQGRDKPARGTRIGKDWVIPDAWVEWAIAYCREQGRHPVPSMVAGWSLEFADYWRAIPGSKGVRLDWAGVWRNAVRNLYAKQAPTQPPRPTLRGI